MRSRFPSRRTVSRTAVVLMSVLMLTSVLAGVGLATQAAAGLAPSDTAEPAPEAEPQSGNASLSLDGEFGYASGAGRLSLDGKSMTIQAWVKHDGNSQKDATIIRNGSGWVLRLQGSGQEPQLYFDLGRQFQSITSDEGIPANEWHHVTVVYDGSQLSLYIDGELDATTGENADIDGGSGQPLRIGTNAAATGGYFSGRLDEVRVWNKALSKFEVQTNYFSELAGDEQGLAAYYPIQSGTDGVEDLAAGNSLALEATASKVTDPRDALPVAPYTHAIPENGSVNVSWSERLGATGQNDADKFKIYRSTSRDGSGRTLVATIKGSVTNYTDPVSISNGQTYYYEVTTVDSNGQESDFAKSQPVRPYGRTGATDGGGGSLALSNDGSNPDYATVGTGDVQSLSLGVQTDSTRGSKDLTIEAWVKHDGQSDDDATIIRKGGGWQFRLEGNSEEPRLYFDLGRNFQDITSNAGVTAGEWHHVAVVYDGNRLELYIDGELDATSSEGADIDNGGDQPVRIGTNAAANGNFYSGRIDEVRVWDTARSPSQLKNNLSAELTGAEDGLVGYWRFDEVDQSSSVRGSSTYKTRVDLKNGAGLATPGTFPVPPRAYARGGDGQVTINWSARASVSSVKLYRATRPNASQATLVDEYARTSAPVVDTNVSNGETYYYWVAGVDTVGQQSDVSYAATARPTTSANPTGVAFSLTASKESNATLAAPRPSLELGKEGDTTMTIEAWVKYTNDSQEDATILRKGQGYQLLLSGTSTNRKVYFDLGRSFQDITSNSGIAAGEWHHVAVTYDGNELAMYIDGQLDSTTSEGADIDDASSRPFRIGAGDSANKRFFDGQLDEIRIWDTVRNATQINDTYQQELTGDESGLIAYFRGCNVADNDKARGSATRGMTLGLTSIDCQDANIDLPGTGSGTNQAPTPELGVSPESPTAGETVEFDARGSVDSDGSIVEYRWDFGDGTTLTTTAGTATHTFGSNGTYTVTVTVVDDDGATGQTSETITVGSETGTGDNQAPSASFLIESKADLTVNFDAADSTDADGNIVEYRWEFGDGTTTTTQTATQSHQYSSVGSYTVTLTVVDDDGATDQATTTVSIGSGGGTNQAPSASFLIDSTSGRTVAVDAADSTDSDGSITTYRWDFDNDGQTDIQSTDPTTSYTYAAGGSYTISLTVVDDAGATDQTTKSVTVQARSQNVSVSRSLGSTSVSAGGSTTVTLTLEVNQSISRLSVTDSFSPAVASASVNQVTINGRSIIPTSATFTNDTGIVVLENLNAGDTVKVTYQVSLPSDASQGDTFALSGNVTTPSETIPISTASITIGAQSGAAKYAGSDRIVQTAELRTAISDWVGGQIDTSALRKVIQAWVSGSPV